MLNKISCPTTFISCSDDQGLVYKDAIFISVHKFVGGVESPGEDWFGLTLKLPETINK